MLVIRALKTVRSAIPIGAPLVLTAGEIVEAERNPRGAVSAIFLGGGERLGLKPDEYEVIRDDEPPVGRQVEVIDNRPYATGRFLRYYEDGDEMRAYVEQDDGDTHSYLLSCYSLRFLDRGAAP